MTAGGWTHGHDIEFITEKFYLQELILLEDEYINNKVKMKCQCMICERISYKTYTAIRLGYSCKCKSKEKREKTTLERYNTKNVAQLDWVKKKMEETCLDTYGTKHPLQNDQVLNKIKKTNLERYGYENTFSVPIFKEKIKRYNIDKYGVEYPMQNADFASKQLLASYNKKEFIFPSGKKIYCQGYEPQALQILLNEGYHENDILTERNEVPSFWYEIEGKAHRYYPDFYISKNNLIIEVKSEYTYNVNKTINLLKEKSCLDAGYNFQFMILEGD